MRLPKTATVAALATSVVTLVASPSVLAAPAAAADTPLLRAVVAAPAHHGLGALPSRVRLSAAARLNKHRSLTAADVPAAVDLRASMPAIGDQGQIGDCVEWAINYAIMGYWANKTGGTGAPYAPLYVYRLVVGGGAPSAGTYPESALQQSQNSGVDTQSDYFQGTTDWQTMPTTAERANAANYKITGWSTLWSGANQGSAAQTLLKQAIAAGSPVAVGIPVYSNFFSYRSGIYSGPSGSFAGNHMIAAVAYDADGLTIQNSWGAGWGASGYAKLSWAFVSQYMFGAYTVAGISTPGTPKSTPPSVTALDPKSGSALGGTSVRITGAGLSTATDVAIGGTSTSFTSSTVNGVTTLTATTPPHPSGAVAVIVTNPAGSSSTGTASTFTYTPAPPAVSGVSPSSGTALGGTTVTVTGVGFSAAKEVRLGGVKLPFKVVNDTTLTLVSPRHDAGAVDIDVLSATATSPRSDADKYTYLAPAAPVVTGLDASAGLTYGGNTVLVTGTNFANVNKVLVGGVTAAYKVASATGLRVTMPTHAAGTVDVQVTDQWSTSATGDADRYTYQAPAVPAITELSVHKGLTYASSPLRITGTGFDRASAVLVDGKSVPFQYVSSTSLTAKLPPHAAGTVTIRVVTPAGTSDPVDVATFTYVAPPAPNLTGLSTSTGPTYVTTAVTVTGTDLSPASAVLVGGKPVAFKQVNDTTLTIVMPTHLAGTVDVQVVTPGGTSATGDGTHFVYVAPPAPVLASLSATSGSTLASTPVRLTGTNFVAVSQVLAGGKPVAFTRVDDRTLAIVLPPHAAGGIDLQVATPGGVSTTGDQSLFTYVTPPAPAVTGLSVSTGPTGSATTVVVSGTDFAGATAVLVSGTPVGFTRVADNGLRVVLAAHAAGPVHLQVVTPSGTSTATDADVFTYVPASPSATITALSPPSAPACTCGWWISAYGPGVGSATRVLVGGTSMPFQRLDDSHIWLVVPPHAKGTIDVQIVNGGGTSAVTSAARFTYT